MFVMHVMTTISICFMCVTVLCLFFAHCVNSLGLVGLEKFKRKEKYGYRIRTHILGAVDGMHSPQFAHAQMY